MVVITSKILPHVYEHFIENFNITSMSVDLKLMIFVISSYNIIDGRNSSVAVVRHRVQNKHLAPISREKVNGQRRKVRVA